MKKFPWVPFGSLWFPWVPFGSLWFPLVPLGSLGFPVVLSGSLLRGDGHMNSIYPPDPSREKENHESCHLVKREP